MAGVFTRMMERLAASALLFASFYMHLAGSPGLLSRVKRAAIDGMVINL